MTYREHIKMHMLDSRFRRSAGIAVILFLTALVLNYYASTYATARESSSVTDIILSNTRTYDVDEFFMIGTVLLVLLIIVFTLRRFNQIPFVLEAVALFVAIRSFFLTLTHIGPFPSAISLSVNFFERINFGGDLFFSGHTGLPFLIALIFWDNKAIRYTFLILSGVLAVIVLLGHIHYTIDVVSAYFITYSIFHIACRVFPSDWQLFGGKY